jgi:uncharacterized YkwD family protein
MKRKLIVFGTIAALTLMSVTPAMAAGGTCNTSERPSCWQEMLSWCLPSWCRPILPDLPDEPETPDEPEVPDVPETPDEPEVPEVPETPDVPEAPETPETPETPDEPSIELSMEQQVVELVNEVRASYGLSELTYSEELSAGARLKSEDMATQGYFDHNSPTYGTPYQMMQSLGITYRSAGENIARGYSSAEAVMEAWMNSEGHRANILNENYTEIGVGYVADGNYWTQWFRS